MADVYLQGVTERFEKMLVGSKYDIGWLQRHPGAPPVEDGTKRFDELLYNIRLYKEHNLPKSVVYLLVTGLFSNHNALNFADTQAYFSKELDLECEIARINSEASVVDNAILIKETILRIYYCFNKRVMILGHSKGGLDAAAALSLYWPDLKNKVVGLVLAQSPYGGNPIASTLLRPPVMKSIHWRRELLELLMSGILKADTRAIEDLTYDKRRQFLCQHPLPRELPVVSFHTRTKFEFDTLFRFYQIAEVEVSVRGPGGRSNTKISVPSMGIGFRLAVMAVLLHVRYGEQSDGCVTRRDAEAPGSVAVRMGRKLDHQWLTKRCLNDEPGEARNYQVCEALFALLMEVAQKKKFF